MKGEIIHFIRRPGCDCEPTDFPTIAFRAPIQPDDLPQDRVRAAPREHAQPEDDDLA